MKRIDGGTLAGVVVFLALIPFTETAHGQTNPSARIHSLGGEHVSGVIPDLYTDLSVNPAYASLAGRLTVSFERRSTYGFAPVFPYLSSDAPYRFYYVRDSYMTNGISVYGIGLSSWRAALFAQWRLGVLEDTRSRFDLEYDWTRSLREWASEDNDFGRIDLMAARSIGETYAIGFRFQGWGYYKSESSAYLELSNDYRDYSLTDLDRETKSQSAESFLGRRLSLDFQAGIIKKSEGRPRTELVLQASLHPLDYSKESYYVSTWKYFDELQQITDYDFRKSLWGDKRKGDLWIFGLAMRHAFDGGIRIYAGGGARTASYDAEWSQLTDDYSWGSSDDIRSGSFTGTGAYRQAGCFFKAGKPFSLSGTLDLYLGLHGNFEWTHSEENPVIRYVYAHHETEDSILIDQPSTLEYTGKAASIYLPLSIEFRPAGYFSVYSAFTLYAEWTKDLTEQPMPPVFYYNRPGGMLPANSPLGVGASPHVTIMPESTFSDWQREWDSGSTVTLGFSLHYRDQFFLDVYSRSAILPDDLGNSTVDVRYVF